MSGKKRLRNINVHFMMTPEENALFEKRFDQLGRRNNGAFLREMELRGVVMNVELRELSEISRLLSIQGNNVNKIARRPSPGAEG